VQALLGPLNSFFEIAFDSPELYFAYLILSFLLYALIFRRYIYSLFDPFVVLVIGICFGTADVFIMYHKDHISTYYFGSYVFTQVFFIMGFLLIRPIKPPSVANNATWQILKPDDIRVTILYYVSAITFVASQILSFAIAGIPILMESRLMIYREGGGVGIFGRIIAIASLITIFLLLDRQFTQKNRPLLAKLFDLFMGLFTVVAFLASGAKSALLSIVFIGFYYQFYFRHFRGYSEAVEKISRFQWKLFILAVIGAFAVIIIELRVNENESISPLLAMLLRFVMSGDVYMYAYPDGALEVMAWSNPLLAMFSDVLGMLRIVPWENLPENLGSQLYQYYTTIDLIKGPNPIHNVFGLFYFGYWGSLLYSFVIGLFLSFIRNKLIFIVPKNKLGGVLLAMVTLPLLAVYGDFSLAVSNFDNVLLVGLPLIAFAVMLSQFFSIIFRKASPGGVKGLSALARP
jgi:oligosaccharide repeat unit polymerase